MGTQFKYVSLDLGATETTYTDLGDITVPIGASRITGICMCAATETGTTAEGYLAIGKLEYIGAPALDGIPVNLSSMEDVTTGAATPRFFPVNIPVPTQRVINPYIKTTLAQTGTVRGQCHLRFE